MKYYRLTQSFNESARWFLGSPTLEGEAIDPRSFTEARATDMNKQLIIPLRKEGPRLEITLADYDMPVFSKRAVEAIYDIVENSIDLVPAKVGNSDDLMFVVNVTKLIDCVDEEKSEFSRWREGDGLPHKIGQYKSIFVLIIDKSVVRGNDIFRVKGWEVALIVSEKIVSRLTSIGVKGVNFIEV